MANELLKANYADKHGQCADNARTMRGQCADNARTTRTMSANADNVRDLRFVRADNADKARTTRTFADIRGHSRTLSAFAVIVRGSGHFRGHFFLPNRLLNVHSTATKNIFQTFWSEKFAEIINIDILAGVPVEPSLL